MPFRGYAIEQLGNLTELKKLKSSGRCRESSSLPGAAGKKMGKAAFKTWQYCAGWVTVAAEEIDRAEACRGLFGMPGSRHVTARDPEVL